MNSHFHGSQIRVHASTVWLVLLFAEMLQLGMVARATAAPATQPANDGGQPITIPNARQYDFTSKINLLTYRVMVYTSPKLDTTKPQPVIYLFDGNYYFGSACDAMAVNQLQGIVVGVGYPSDDPDEIVRRRSFDLSLPTTEADKKHGGGDAFLRVAEEEVKPLVAAHYKVDANQQSLYGHSLGGLMVLRQLFKNPKGYSTYTAASPSIWWHSRAVLEDEAAFTKKAAGGDLHLRLLITSADDEEYHGTDASKLDKAKANGMVSNASNLAARLAAINPQNVVVTRDLIQHENHRSGSIPSLVRSLIFTFHGEE